MLSVLAKYSGLYESREFGTTWSLSWEKRRRKSYELLTVLTQSRALLRIMNQRGVLARNRCPGELDGYTRYTLVFFRMIPEMAYLFLQTFTTHLVVNKKKHDTS